MIGIPSLVNRFAIPRIDILKIDIEGAEESVFATAPEEWLSCVELIIMEIHSERLEGLICGILKQHGFSIDRYRSLWYFRAPEVRV